jgi:flagellar export protein FliJ
VKGFQFPLERVLSWRQTQQTMAEAALARLMGEHRSVQQARIDVQTGRVTAQGAVARAAATQGTELARLERLCVWTDREDRRLAARSRELEKAIEDQKRVVAETVRNVKMLERLRTRRQSEWRAEMDHEFETQTGEWAVSQWRRRQAE